MPGTTLLLFLVHHLRHPSFARHCFCHSSPLPLPRIERLSKKLLFFFPGRKKLTRYYERLL